MHCFLLWALIHLFTVSKLSVAVGSVCQCHFKGSNSKFWVLKSQSFHSKFWGFCCVAGRTECASKVAFYLWFWLFLVYDIWTHLGSAIVALGWVLYCHILIFMWLMNLGLLCCLYQFFWSCISVVGFCLKINVTNKPPNGSFFCVPFRLYIHILSLFSLVATKFSFPSSVVRINLL